MRKIVLFCRLAILEMKFNQTDLGIDAAILCWSSTKTISLNMNYSSRAMFQMRWWWKMPPTLWNTHHIFTLNWWVQFCLRHSNKCWFVKWKRLILLLFLFWINVNSSLLDNVAKYCGGEFPRRIGRFLFHQTSGYFVPQRFQPHRYWFGKNISLLHESCKRNYCHPWVFSSIYISFRFNAQYVLLWSAIFACRSIRYFGRRWGQKSRTCREGNAVSRGPRDGFTIHSFFIGKSRQRMWIWRQRSLVSPRLSHSFKMDI